jgi:hypothetical protein
MIESTMKTFLPGLTLALLLPVPALAADASGQLAQDIVSIADVVVADDRAAVTNYLYNGPTGSGKGDVHAAATARKALNQIKPEQPVAPALARVLQRHVLGTNFPSDARYYAFAKLTYLARQNSEAADTAASSATEIARRDQDLLKGLAEQLLRERQSSSAAVASNNFNASQLVGRWQHTDAERHLTSNLAFQRDGTFTGSFEINGRSSGSFAGKWTLKDGILNYEYTASLGGSIPIGMIDYDKMIDLTKDQYTIENALGSREHYVRIQ